MRTEITIADTAARQAHYREILEWRGRLKWEGDQSIAWTEPETGAEPPASSPSSGAAQEAGG